MNNHANPQNNKAMVNSETRKLLLFLWRSRFPVLIGLSVGTILATVGGLFARVPVYKTELLLELDRESLPAISQSEKLESEFDRLFHTFEAQKDLLESIYDVQDNTSQKHEQITRLLINQTESSILNIEKNRDPKTRKKYGSPIFEFIPSLDGGRLVTVISLPHSGYAANFGSKFVATFNELIEDRNRKEISSYSASTRVILEDEKGHVANSQSVLLRGGEENEAEEVRIRSELAGIEFELLKSAKSQAGIMDYLTFTRTSGLMSDSSNDIRKSFLLSDPVVNAESRVEQIILLISALSRQNKLSPEEVKNFNNRVVDLSMLLKGTEARKSVINSVNRSLSGKIGEISTKIAIDRSQVILPKYKINQDYFNNLLRLSLNNPNSVPLEKQVFHQKIAPFIGLGLLLGGFLGLLYSALKSAIQTHQIPFREMMGRRPKIYYKEKDATVI